MDIDGEACEAIHSEGYEIVHADATRLDLGDQFEVVVCGDLIEHVSNPGMLLECIASHMSAEGVAVITTPNPLSVHRCFAGIFDDWIGVNEQHTLWLDPFVMWELVERSPLRVEGFFWINTPYKSWVRNRLFKFPMNRIANWVARLRPQLRLDFGVVLRRRQRG